MNAMTKSAGTRIRHKTMTDQVANAIRRMILSHELEPGQRITQAELAQMLGVSTMPVREAFVRLVSDGMLVAHGNRAFLVSQMTEARIRDIYWLHAVIAGELTARAWDHKNKVLIAEMSRLHSEYLKAEEAKEHDQQFQINWDFHAILNAAADAPTLINALMGSLQYFPESAYKIKGWREIAGNWQVGLINQFVGGNRAGAANVATTSIDRAADIFIDDVWKKLL